MNHDLVAGVAIRAGSTFIACVSAPYSGDILALARPESADKIKPSGGLDGAPQLQEYGERIRQHLRDHGVRTLGLLDTTRYKNWKYADAVSRVQAVSLVMLACANEGIRFTLVKQHAAVGLVRAPKLDGVDFSLFGLDTQAPYWNSGMSEAYAAAAVILDAENIGK